MVGDKDARIFTSNEFVLAYFAFLLGLIITIISLLAPIFEHFVAFILNANAERLRHIREEKEKRYFNLIQASDGFKDKGSKEERARFLREYQLAWLYASDDVIRAINKFFISVHENPNKYFLKQQTSDEDRSSCYKEMVLSMRRDLLGRKTRLNEADFMLLKIPK